tara:strand:- start:308 stop:1378 length:1071 start_codon:yes stop_codon:yes gene_type:complete
MGEPPVIDPDIARAETLPSKFYTDPHVFQQVFNRFGGNWHFAVHRNQLTDCNVIPLKEVEGLTKEPMLMTVDGKIRCLSNVCTHRGMLVANEPCSANVLQCPYHGRTFGLDGKFRNMPEFKQVENFPSEIDDLAEFPHGEWNGLLFTTVDGTSFNEWISPLADRIGWIPMEEFQHDASRHRDYMIDANWALYVDNYLEGFHIPFVHNDLHGVLAYDEYETELFDGGVLQIGIAKDGEACFELPEDSIDYGKNIAAYYYWLYPGLMLNFYPWGLSVNVVIPTAVDRTRIVYHGYVWNQEMLGKGAGGDLDKVESEDQFVVEATQRGVSSRSYDRGRYSPKMESGVHHFHRILTNNHR